MGFILDPFRPKYDTMTFCQIWPSYKKFKEDYDYFLPLLSSTDQITEVNVKAIYYYLYSRYGNNPIVNFDVTQFKMKVFAVIADQGPLWQRKRKIQEDLRNLSDSELLQGSKQIYNHSFNPSTDPSTQTLEELTTIDDQNTSLNKKSKMEAYSLLWSNLHVVATEEFLNKFKHCFCRFVGDQHPALFITEEEEKDGSI